MKNTAEKYMKQALSEAMKGAGKVSPNPLVGAVIVKNGVIIGRGYHKEFGGKHAEANALDSCITSPEGAEMYVNLEPCSHHGKNPPCAERIIREKLKKVFVGTVDPSPHSAGKGIEMLRMAGIEVETGVCGRESLHINRVFFHCLNSDMPYIILKAAVSVDGCMAAGSNDSKWITGEMSRKHVHRLRSIYDAVLVGKNTVIHDDPMLNVRSVKGRDPVRIVVDEDLSLDLKYRVFDKNSKTFVITSYGSDPRSETNLKENGITVLHVERNGNFLDLRTAFRELFKAGIRSVMVEGGGEIHSYLLNNRLADRVNIFISPKLIGSGKRLFSGSSFSLVKECVVLDTISRRFFGDDIFIDALVGYGS